LELARWYFRVKGVGGAYPADEAAAVYAGVDGVFAPMVTQAGKGKRRQARAVWRRRSAIDVTNARPAAGRRRAVQRYSGTRR
jgi:hypothetical protein